MRGMKKRYVLYCVGMPMVGAHTNPLIVGNPHPDRAAVGDHRGAEEVAPSRRRKQAERG